MKHKSDCPWELADCEYKETHHYCPHPEHACTCEPKKTLSERLTDRGFKPVGFCPVLPAQMGRSVSVADLTLARLAKNPVVYSVVFCHDEDGMSFTVSDVQDSEHDRRAVARDFEAAAESLRESKGEHRMSCHCIGTLINPKCPEHGSMQRLREENERLTAELDLAKSYEPYPDNMPLAGPDMPPMQTILDLVRYAMTVYTRFGNTAIELGGLQWGGSALNAMSKRQQEIEQLRAEVTSLRAENELFIDKLRLMRNRASMIVSDYDGIQKEHLATLSGTESPT